MKPVHLASVDLNLLVVLDELLRNGSTVKAAKRLGRTQSAVSHALNRLRDLLGDPLFVRVGSELRPTALARQIEGPLRALLTSTEGLLFGEGAFDPSGLSRVLTFAAADVAEGVVLPRLVPLLRRRAPKVDVLTRLIADDALPRALESGEVDIALTQGNRGFAGVVFQPLFDCKYVCVVRRGHPRIRGRLTLEDFLAVDHALVSPRGQPGSLIDEALAQMGRERRVVVLTPYPSSAVLLAAQTDLAVVVPERIAAALLAVAPDRVEALDLPIPIPPFRFGCFYAAARRSDPLLTWLRALLVEACQDEA